MKVVKSLILPILLTAWLVLQIVCLITCVIANSWLGVVAFISNIIVFGTIAFLVWWYVICQIRLDKAENNCNANDDTK